MFSANSTILVISKDIGCFRCEKAISEALSSRSDFICASVGGNGSDQYHYYHCNDKLTSPIDVMVKQASLLLTPFGAEWVFGLLRCRRVTTRSEYGGLREKTTIFLALSEFDSNLKVPHVALSS